jgi:plasmid stabilization system protein ParE
VKLKVAKRAEQQAGRIQQWWVEHRPSAPRLFPDELEQTFRLICENPGLGVRWPTARHPEMRRVLMPKTEHHVYFRVDESTQTVHILAIWGTPRGRGPLL